ncbi:hypothetical protein PISL3812_05168 [Talaromyces islandicus]|uniref:Uncharacterized protein n=1 Tax=Talaromyces islandicus TaxID=28573 RepID=A0A0U1LZI3_TALIS|nr:hypothetical protein PISL3812_05168 [Talaromyces islandicus]
MPDSYSSSSYYYSSATSTTNGTETSGHRYTTSSHTDHTGNTIVRTAHQDLGAPAVVEERHYDRTGQELLPPPSSSDEQWGPGRQRRIADITDDEEYNYGVTSTGMASVDTLSQDFSLESNVPGGGGGSSPADDPSGSAIGRYRSSVDEGAVDPVTGNRYSQRDLD